MSNEDLRLKVAELIVNKFGYFHEPEADQVINWIKGEN